MIKSLYDEELTGRCDKDKFLQGNEPGCWDSEQSLELM